ncbi:kinesin motor domain containing protein, putative [Trypanosoma equiperdum]|uniref:MORN repeat-containing protein 3 n=3 Tax=Trypanozoon TaxID=39700 RepID=Q388E6_TRYB2|nr:hypothetical protein, conserved [Trypanosoma brucei gambiense DAL972]XP_827936.1 hypothetical protein, conserved [Trypanosoma brucei brucei TREU927]EAN78824.1 hypothetical protein, conserved [Trypanosoma brucei brucei TREU927]CBH16669.1 hypothetical protein, conserved [Trypanosoma brucei gambiense DAL972]SCU67879.1 kinesin motor domain containing protein, putative [Trypanosoma equiperdum]|eukprot:XP_011778933.1 hypothetical protein, conserved [Trypanosoma brucei gambiense DAL972]
MENSSSFDRVRIAVRERPIAEEDILGVKLHVRQSEGKLFAYSPDATEGLMYDCDYFFPCSAKQEELYHAIGLEMIDLVAQGLSSNVVVMGFAVTGKTHTLFGDNESVGLIYDTVGGLYQRLGAVAGEFETDIVLRYWEMNRDSVEDNLLDEDGSERAYTVTRDTFDRLVIPNLMAVRVPTFEDFLEQLERGNRNRVRRTKQRQSRWHGFLQLMVSTTPKVDSGKTVIRSMTFVHLKGTDCLGLKGVAGDQLKEGCGINVSVTLLRAAVIHSINYREKRRSRATTPEGHHDLICSSQSFFMECKFSRLMSQFISGLEASFVVGCTNPLQFKESIDTLENLQYFRRLRCALKAIVVVSERGLLLKELRRQEELLGAEAVAELYGSDANGCPLNEAEEKLLQIYRKLHGFDPRRGAVKSPAVDPEAAIIERCKTRAQRLHGKVDTHGMRKRIFLTPRKTESYEGQWEDGKFGGFGELLKKLSKYRGEFRNGLREGEGTLWLRKDVKSPWVRVYRGEWLAGKRDGVGISWEENGDVYEGGWSGGKRDGFGRLFFANGDIYKGEFRDDQHYGRGILRLTSGDWYDGYWALGLREGPGLWCYTQKQQYFVGEWSKGICKCGTMLDMPDKTTNENSRFIPRLGLLRCDEVLELEQLKLRDRRAQEYPEMNVEWRTPLVSAPLGALSKNVDSTSGGGDDLDAGNSSRDGEESVGTNVAEGWGLDVE